MDFQPPILVTNFKAYKEATGVNAVELAKAHELVAREMSVNIAVAGQAMDLSMLAASVSLNVLAQHVDGCGYGAYTGHVPVEIAHSMGVDGSLLNHSERRISDTQIQSAVDDMKRLGMISIVCAESVEEAHRFIEMGADYVAIEPPELIGGDVSISTARPELITEAVEKIGSHNVLIGAGIKSGADVRKAMELGAGGVLVASGIVCAADPVASLRDLCSGLTP
jgi:triosephosphate isomerase (TIM)